VERETLAGILSGMDERTSLPGPAPRSRIAGWAPVVGWAALIFILSSQPNLRFVSDETLDVVVRNLAENAIRYAGPGATLTLSVAREDGATVLAASDDGVGVLERDLPRLFERFYRADRVRASRGTGLGLAIVKHIVASAGGTVEARSARGHGLEIRCAFPEP